MYSKQFGLTENPFTITPDPRYLYLSDRHQEGLAHLLYGTAEDGGFVQLTGEVGTGKTTLIRALLEQHIEGIDVALVLNPRLTVIEFVAAICDELRIAYPPDCQTMKPLIDSLNAALLESHAAGRHTVLIVDEAQNLSLDVLEQVRLLTNLETSRHKLLRIILVGQPELSTLLARQDMRQLAQRITARFHLVPLNRSEVREYVRHRLRVAGGDHSLFSEAAVRTLYRRCGGIPRLINVVCERALLGAYAVEARHIDAATIRRAAREALPARMNRSTWSTTRAIPLGIGAMAIGAAVGAISVSQGWLGAPGRSGDGGEAQELVAENSQNPQTPLPTLASVTPLQDDPATESTAAKTASPQPSASAEPVEGATSTETGTGATQVDAEETPLEKPAVAEEAPSRPGDTRPVDEARGDHQPVVPPVTVASLESADPPPANDDQALDRNLENADSAVEVSAASALSAYELSLMMAETPADRDQTYRQLFGQWGITLDGPLPQDPCVEAVQSGLQCLLANTHWDTLRAWNRPALLTLAGPNGVTEQVLLIHLDDNQATVRLDEKNHMVDLAGIDLLWTGDALVLWRPQTDAKLIALGASGESVLWLRGILNRLYTESDGGVRAVSIDPLFDPELEAQVKAFQTSHGLVPDGIVGPLTMILLNNLDPRSDTPLLVQASSAEGS